MMQIQFKNKGQINESVFLPISKSECNRALMLSAWSDGKIRLSRISDAGDSQLLHNLLNHNDSTTYDAEDAGTTLRFITAYLALRNERCLVTGSERMMDRPIAGLVDALRKLGCRIECKNMEGFPPLQLLGFDYTGNNILRFNSLKSSQFISSLMMAAPSLPDGLILELPEDTASASYIRLTAELMHQAGLKVTMDNLKISIPNQEWKEAEIQCGADWSSASYWYAILASLPAGSSFYFPGLSLESFQGDRICSELFRFWNIESQAASNGIRILKSGEAPINKKFIHSFEDCPDLALSFICLCAATGIESEFHGLASLKIKESDRLKAIQQELAKTGTALWISPEGTSAALSSTKGSWPEVPPVFECHQDHRIAMSLSILLAGKDRSAFFADETVVKKSYPDFWKELSKAGFQIMN